MFNQHGYLVLSKLTLAAIAVVILTGTYMAIRYVDGALVTNAYHLLAFFNFVVGISCAGYLFDRSRNYFRKDNWMVVLLMVWALSLAYIGVLYLLTILGTLSAGVFHATQVGSWLRPAIPLVMAVPVVVAMEMRI